jgi:hypothetical protein
LEQSSGLIFTCQYAELASSLEYHTFPAKVSRHWKVVLAFLDDILVLGKDFEGHLANLRAVLVRFREYGLTLKPKNVNCFKRPLVFEFGLKLTFGESAIIRYSDPESTILCYSLHPPLPQ